MRGANRMRASSQSGILPVSDANRAATSRFAITWSAVR